ncbi:MAG: DoxX family protein [Pricia sp.]
MKISVLITFFSAISFLFFGISCFVMDRMKSEYVRYGLESQRELVGVLQILGGLGLIFGYFYLPTLGLVAATGLCLLMILGFGVRLKIKDTFWESSPSFIYALLNAYIAFVFWNGMPI